ncbi:MAG: hypothetical protein KJ077_27830 [Anaerolineae bacterium]|nr:hypothetical protein [Anaerolineae bacterium]
MMPTRMRTTTLIIETPISYEGLAQNFRLIRYAVPERFNFINDKNKFKRLHVQLREQLKYPYRFFTHDKINGPLAVYVLYEPQAAITPLKLNFVSGDDELAWCETQFEQLPLHLIMKLLQANYFKARKTSEFISESKYYIQAKLIRGKVVCLEIEIKGDSRNKDDHLSGAQEYKVIGHATRFGKRNKSKITESYKRLYDYFQQRSPKEGQSFFTRIPPNKIDDFEGDIYSLYTDPDERATLDYHSQLRPERTRGKILYDFIDNFTLYLAGYGIIARQKNREFTEHKPKGNNADLPLEKLEPVKLVCIRQNPNTVPIRDYQNLLQGAYPYLSLAMIDELKADERSPLLILQDYNKEDFQVGGILAEKQDPRSAVYNTCSDAPKQTINVNPNEAADFSEVSAYLNYPLISLKKDIEQGQGKRFDLRFAVCLNQLYLKDLIFNQRNVIGRLPCLDTVEAPLLQYAFIRKQTYEGNSQHVMIYFRDNTLQFVDLGNPTGKQLLYELAEAFGIDWDDVIEKFMRKYFKKKDSDIKRYDFIIGPGQVIEIEDIQERVLYEYDEIIRRKHDLDTPCPIEALKLAHRYNDLRGSTRLSLEKLLGLAEFTTRKAQQSQAFLEQLRAYDDFLDELARHRVEISFNELTSEANMPTIAQIFDIKPDNKGKYNRGKFKGLYQTLGMFLSDKGGDVQQYSRIWYDNENCFMVGSPEGLKDKQPRAHLIRKFDVYMGQDLFDIQIFMPTMEVKFVRHEQYTVYPYFFHLIDLYVETKLNFTSDAGEASLYLV